MDSRECRNEVKLGLDERQKSSNFIGLILSLSTCATSLGGFNTSQVERLCSKSNNNKHTERTMAKAMSKSQIAATIADQVGITKKQAVQALDTVAELAYKQAKNTFTLHGLGKLVLVNRPAREITMQFGPKKGQTVKIPAKRVVKFRVAKAAKDAILGSK
jgi:DNA-binding protein HU-beta